jgi:hypothetical protein
MFLDYLLDIWLLTAISLTLDSIFTTLSNLSIPVATVLLGSVTFVSGQIIRKGVIQPYRELQRLRGEISADIYFYNEYISNDAGDDEIRQEIKDTFRRHASELNSQMKMYSLIKPISYLPTVPDFKNMKKARKSLTHLSNKVKIDNNTPFENYEKVEEIKENLNLQ